MRIREEIDAVEDTSEYSLKEGTLSCVLSDHFNALMLALSIREIQKF